jgi:hypothetical protein
MIEINNKHIVLMLIIIIIGVFICNYDVYVIRKNEPLCKPVFVTKRELSPELRAKLNRTESEMLKETFNNLADIEYFENFGNLDNNQELSQYDIPPKSFSTFTIPSLTNQHKIKVIDSVIKILSYIPTNYCESQIKQMVEYFAIIYETSQNLEAFYKNIASSTKIKESPYNSKYSHLILYLIGKFDDDYISCSNQSNPDTQCAMNELLKEIIDKNLNSDNIKISNTSQQTSNTSQQTSNTSQQTSNTTPTKSVNYDYLAEQINTAIDTQPNFNPKEVLNIIERSKNNQYSQESESESQQKQNVILPSTTTVEKTNNSNNSNNSNYSNPIYQEESNYLNNQYQSDSSVPKYKNSNTTQKHTKSYNQSSKASKTPKCNGAKCTYKCDSSYSNAISYLESELKPLESFGNIYDNYAQF